MNPSTPHPDYAAALSWWSRCRDVAAGSDAIKAAGSRYLPHPAGMSWQDYAAYLQRAAFFNAMKRTIQALSGAVLQRAPSVTVPDLVRPHLSDLTLRDEPLETVAQRIVTEVLTVGRCGVLLDTLDAGRPYWVLWPAERIVNWRSGPVGDDPDALIQVVLREDVRDPLDDDPFSHKTQPRYRECVLHPDGVYRVRLWTKSDPGYVVNVRTTPFMPQAWIEPTRRGTPLGFIPFTFVGPQGITSDVEAPPLLDLAHTNISHYRNSADLEYALHLVASPTPWASGVIGDTPLKIGPSVCWQLAENGKAGMLEFGGQGVGAIREAMIEKKKEMAALGARLLDEPSARAAETATAIRMRHSGEAAALRTIAASVSAALTRAMRWHVWWFSVAARDLPLDVRVDLSQEFFTTKASPDDIRAGLLAVQAGQMSFATFYNLLEQGGWTRPGVNAEQERHEINADDLDSPITEDDAA